MEMKYTEDQIQCGFWNSIPTNFKKISEVDEYQNEKFINICYDLKYYWEGKQKRKILSDWIKTIPTLPADFVSLDSTVPTKLLNATFQNSKLKGLYIKATKAKSIDDILNLKNIEYLYIGNGSQIKSIEPLGKLTNLKALSVENFQKIEKYDVLSKLTNLEFLSIEGSMWSVPTVDDLEFISHLSNLKQFNLTAAKLNKKSLKPFYTLKNLKSLSLCVDFSREEITELNNKLPNLKYGIDYFNEAEQEFDIEIYGSNS